MMPLGLYSLSSLHSPHPVLLLLLLLYILILIRRWGTIPGFNGSNIKCSTLLFPLLSAIFRTSSVPVQSYWFFLQLRNDTVNGLFVTLVNHASSNLMALLYFSMFTGDEWIAVNYGKLFAAQDKINSGRNQWHYVPPPAWSSSAAEHHIIALRMFPARRDSGFEERTVRCCQI